MRSISSPRSAATLILAATVVLAACEGGDARTEQIQPGMERDSAVALLTGTSPIAAASDSAADSLRNVWRKTQYLMAGRQIEVIWYSPSGERRTASDTVPEERVIPVVVVDGKVVGVGRNAYEQIASQYGLPLNRY